MYTKQAIIVHVRTYMYRAKTWHISLTGVSEVMSTLDMKAHLSDVLLTHLSEVVLTNLNEISANPPE